MNDTLHRLGEVWATLHITELQLVTAGMIFSAIWSVICRVNHMQFGRTRLLVFFQHAALALGLLGGLILTEPWARASMALGVFLFLVMGSGRWRHGAPADITKPAPLDESPLKELPSRYYPGAKR